jgi:hypothetical protein
MPHVGIVTVVADVDVVVDNDVDVDDDPDADVDVIDDVDVDVAIVVELVGAVVVVVVCAAASDTPHRAAPRPTRILRIPTVTPEARAGVNHSPTVDTDVPVSTTSTGGLGRGEAICGRGSAIVRLKTASRARRRLS